MNIGYYAHHHGSGHCRQADKLVALLPPDARQKLTVFTSAHTQHLSFATLTESNIVRLPAEDETPSDVLPGRAGQHWQPHSMHYSPVGNANIQARSLRLLSEIATKNIQLMIVDVSVEVALLCRTASVPYLYVRLPGERDDTPHVNAYQGALALIAPYPQALESKHTPDWVVAKTLYLGFLSESVHPNQTVLQARQQMASALKLSFDEFDERLTDLSGLEGLADSQRQLVTVLKGYGGHKNIDARLAELRQLLPQAFIISLGPIEAEMSKYVDVATEVAQVMPFIVGSDLVVMACGLNSVAQIYATATPMVVLPDERPHREQVVMAEALIAIGRAVSWANFVANPEALFHQHSIYQSSIYQGSHPTSDQFDIVLDSPDMAKQSVCAKTFIKSLAQTPQVKPWFYDWLLPHLGLKPERMN